MAPPFHDNERRLVPLHNTAPITLTLGNERGLNRCWILRVRADFKFQVADFAGLNREAELVLEVDGGAGDDVGVHGS